MTTHSTPDIPSHWLPARSSILTRLPHHLHLAAPSPLVSSFQFLVSRRLALVSRCTLEATVTDARRKADAKQTHELRAALKELKTFNDAPLRHDHSQLKAAQAPPPGVSEPRP